jgi:parvulin-like peptidyl-prolyl isomerase
MVLDFEKAVWAADAEATPTKFIKTQFGFHIIWVHSKTEHSE